MIYYLILLYLEIFCFFDFYNKKKIIFISFFILILFAGLRYRIGYDWYPYQQFADNIENISDLLKHKSFTFNNYSYEIGYKYLNVVNKTLGGNYETLVFIYVLFNMLCLNFFMKKIKIKNIHFFLLLYYVNLFYTFEFGQVRQSIGFHIFMIGIIYFINKKYIKYILFSFLAFLFHYSVILPFFLIIMVSKIKITRNKILLLILILIICNIFQLEPTKKFFYIMYNYLPEFYKYRLDYYLIRYTGRSMGMVFYEKIFLGIILIIFYKRLKKRKNNELFFKLFFLDLLISIIFIEYHVFTSRFRSYFQYGIIFIYSQIPEKLKKDFIVVLFLFFYSMLVITYRFLPAENKTHFFPYKNYIVEKYIKNNIEESKKESIKRWEKSLEIVGDDVK